MKSQQESNNKPKVFIIQRPRPKADGWLPNFDSAAKFGAIHYIFDQDYRAHANPDKARDHAKEVLGSQFDPRQDYILPTVFGDPAAFWIAMPLIIEIGWEMATGYLKYLYWSRGRGPEGMTNETGYYEECKIPI